MMIDTHPHIISEDTVTYPITPVTGKRSKWSEAEGSFPLERYIESMKKAGVDKAVLVHSSTTYGFDCSYVADSIAKHPGTLWGVGCVDFMAPDIIDTVNYWMNERKLCGFRFFSHGSTHSEPIAIDDPRIFPAYEYFQKNQIPLVMQIRMDSIEMLRNVMSNFPNLRIVLDHAGQPNLEDGIPYKGLDPVLEFAKYPELHLKITSSFLIRRASKGNSTPRDFMRTIADKFGADRIMWGSNCPSFSNDLSECVRIAEDACTVLSEEEREKFFGKNTQRFYHLW